LLTNRESPEERRNIALNLNDAGTGLVKKVNRQRSHRDRPARDGCERSGVAHPVEREVVRLVIEELADTDIATTLFV
jgi:hypothetical protein